MKNKVKFTIISTLNKTKVTHFFLLKQLCTDTLIFFKKEHKSKHPKQMRKKNEKYGKRQKNKEENQKRNKEAKEENDKPCAFYTLVLSSTQVRNLFLFIFLLNFRREFWWTQIIKKHPKQVRKKNKKYKKRQKPKKKTKINK